MVESQPSKLLVAGSIPVSRSSLRLRPAPEGELRPASQPSRVRGGRPIGRRRLAHGRAATDASAEARREGESAKADVAQLAERVLGKDEVTSSILVIGSTPFTHGATRANYGRRVTAIWRRVAG